jgi:biopolymer transport protein ExbD
MAISPSERRRLRGRKKEGDPKEPNLLPIMNLFLTIIPFLLMFIATVQMALIGLNFGGGGGGDGRGGGGGGDGANQELTIIIYASTSADGKTFPGFEIRDPSGTNLVIKNDVVTTYKFNELNDRLKEIKGRYKDRADITIKVYPDVLYGNVIKLIDLCKNNGFPNVIYKPVTKYYGDGA